jgi:hypothetical protein
MLPAWEAGDAVPPERGHTNSTHCFPCDWHGVMHRLTNRNGPGTSFLPPPSLPPSFPSPPPSLPPSQSGTSRRTQRTFDASHDPVNPLHGLAQKSTPVGRREQVLYMEGGREEGPGGGRGRRRREGRRKVRVARAEHASGNRTAVSIPGHHGRGSHCKVGREGGM